MSEQALQLNIAVCDDEKVVADCNIQLKGLFRHKRTSNSDSFLIFL